MNSILQLWHEATLTSLGFFWMALWAFALGYLISSLIQVLVTQSRMQQVMGEDGPKSMALGTFFGFLSSSCSFSALSTTRALFQKGAGLAPAIAFMLASTNLVIELGIVIAIFLSWHFVIGEYVGGILLILFAWLFIRVTNPKKLIKQAREKLDESTTSKSGETNDWRRKVMSKKGWQQIGRTYVMEWQMVWKDVLIGFTVAGIISAFVPNAWFEALFLGSGTGNNAPLGFFAVLEQTLIGPIVAFLTFIGSMGNIPLAALLYDRGVSFAGVMAFIFSDLVVLPVLRINASYYGWKMALYMLSMLMIGLVVTALLLHYGLSLFDLLPEGGNGQAISERDHFQLNYGFYLNIAFLLVTTVLVWLYFQGKKEKKNGHHHEHGNSTSMTDRILKVFTILALIWLAGGLVVG